MLSRTSSTIASGFQQLLLVELPPRVAAAVGERPAGERGGQGAGSRDLAEFKWGLLSLLCPPELIDRVLVEQGRREERRRLLPARVVVYGLLLMCLRPELGYAKLMQHLGGLAGVSGNWATADKSAFAHARQRLGWEVMEQLFRAVARPLGEPERDDCCFWRGLRVVALDGTTLELPRHQELENGFGGQIANDGSGRRAGAPLVRLVMLLECGTRALIDVAFGHYNLGESSLARLLRGLGPGMLVLADRGFPSKPLWEAYLASGADLLWRAKSNIARRRLGWLADGTYLVSLGKGNPVTVRVIEYRLQGSCEVYRLLTNLLDPTCAPAPELAQLYSQRWECETLTREIKIELCRKGLLRSRTELGVRQELWATFIVHTLTRRFAYLAASRTPQRDPDRISFTLVQDTIRRSIGRYLITSNRLLQLALAELTKLANLVIRRPRSCPRVRYKPTGRYGDRAHLATSATAARPGVLILLGAA